MLAGTPALKALKMILSQAAAREESVDRAVALYDIVAAFVHVTTDEVVVVLPPEGFAGTRSVLLPVESTERHSKSFEEAAATVHESAQEIRMTHECSYGWNISSSRSCGQVRAEGCDELLTRLGVFMSS